MQDLSLHILDIAENSIEAGARRIVIRIEERPRLDRLTLEIADDGRGMNDELLARAKDPFVTTKTGRRIGLGLPLLAQAAEAAGGALSIASRPGRSTRVQATFRLSHIDRKPLGDIAQTMAVLIAGHPDIDVLPFRYARSPDSPRRHYAFDPPDRRLDRGRHPGRDRPDKEDVMLEHQVTDILTRHQADPGSIIAILQDLQEEFSYLPPPALRMVARELSVPLSRVMSLATFYKAFSLKPKGKHPIHVCLGTACHVRGAQLVLEKFERDLGLKSGDTSADGEFSLDSVRCVGCCGLAPVVTVGEDVHGKVAAAKIPGLIKKYKT
jgi:NADH:ubiquinone oxidoreductase subunit E